jgi:hypothetical protein
MVNHLEEFKMANKKVKIEALVKKQDQIKQQIASITARVRKDVDRILTRKKILIGAYMLEKYKTNVTEMSRLMQELDGFLIRQHDRLLFGLKIL